MQGIYFIRDNQGRHYIGSSKNIKNRLRVHFQQLKLNRHHNVYLQRVYNKHGNIFEAGVLEETDLLFERESFYIDKLGEYNIGSVGGGDNLTNHPNRLDIVDRRTATWHENHKEGLHNYPSKFGDTNPNWRGGPKLCKCGTPIQPANMVCSQCRDRVGVNNPFYGKQHTDEYKQRASERMKGKKPTNMRKVIIDSIEYESLAEAERQLNVSKPMIIYRIKSPKYDYHYA